MGAVGCAFAPLPLPKRYSPMPRPAAAVNPVVHGPVKRVAR